jgi:hypothetical protein
MCAEVDALGLLELEDALRRSKNTKTPEIDNIKVELINILIQK